MSTNRKTLKAERQIWVDVQRMGELRERVVRSAQELRGMKEQFDRLGGISTPALRIAEDLKTIDVIYDLLLEKMLKLEDYMDTFTEE